MTIEENEEADVSFVGVDNPFSAGTLETVLDAEVTVAGDGEPVTVTGDDGEPALIPPATR